MLLIFITYTEGVTYVDMNTEWGFGGVGTLFFFVTFLLGLSLTFPSSTSDLEEGENGRAHHRENANQNYTHNSSNSTKHRHKHNNGYKHIGNEENEEDNVKHQVIEPPISLIENYTEGYPVDPSYADWPEEDGYPWYVY